VVARGNYIKKIVGLNIFQASVFMFYISIGKVEGGTAPIFPIDMNIDPAVIYSNPLPHVLILTAIVVGVATTSLGLALIVRIREEYGTIEEEDILEIDSGTSLMLHVAGVSGLTIIDQLPMLTVVVPMLAAPLCVLIGNRSWMATFFPITWGGGRRLLVLSIGSMLQMHLSYF